MATLFEQISESEGNTMIAC